MLRGTEDDLVLPSQVPILKLDFTNIFPQNSAGAEAAQIAKRNTLDGDSTNTCAADQEILCSRSRNTLLKICTLLKIGKYQCIGGL